MEASCGLLRGLGGLPFDAEASWTATWSLLGASSWPTGLHFGSQNGAQIDQKSFQDSFKDNSGSTSCEKLIFEGCMERNHYFCSCRAPRKPTPRHPNLSKTLSKRCSKIILKKHLKNGFGSNLDGSYADYLGVYPNPPTS